MSEKNSVGILKGLAVISDSFKSMHITEDSILEVIDSDVFVHFFDDVEDPRMKGKVQYPLSNLLALIFVAMIEIKTMSFTEMASYMRYNKEKLESYGLIKDGVVPSHDTIRRILTLLDSQSLFENTTLGIYNFFLSLEKNAKKRGERKHISFDGKEVRGSGRSKDTNNPKRNIAMLNIYDSSLMTAIHSEPIDEKENEIPVIQRLLKDFHIKGNLFTADALHCQKDTVEIIHGGKGYYVFVAKENQKLLVQEIEAKFNNPKSRIQKYEEDERIFEMISISSSHTLRDEWKGLSTFVKMVSKKRKKECIRYFISNSKDVHLIIEAIENRWKIENELHKFKDVVLHEDVCRSTDKNVLQNIAIINNLITQIFYIYKSLSSREADQIRMGFKLEPIECIKYVLGFMSSEQIVNQLVLELKKSKRVR